MSTTQLERLPSYLNGQAQVLEAASATGGPRVRVRHEIERVHHDLARICRRMSAIATRRASQAVPTWYAPAQERLKYLGTLEDDWDSYGAQAPNAWALAMAQKALRLAARERLEPRGIVPSPENGIALVFGKGEKHADIEIFNDGDILYLVDNRQDKSQAHQVAPDASGVAHALQSIRTFLDS